MTAFPKSRRPRSKAELARGRRKAVTRRRVLLDARYLEALEQREASRMLSGEARARELEEGISALQDKLRAVKGDARLPQVIEWLNAIEGYKEKIALLRGNPWLSGEIQKSSMDLRKALEEKKNELAVLDARKKRLEGALRRKPGNQELVDQMREVRGRITQVTEWSSALSGQPWKGAERRKRGWVVAPEKHSTGAREGAEIRKYHERHQELQRTLMRLATELELGRQEIARLHALEKSAESEGVQRVTERLEKVKAGMRKLLELEKALSTSKSKDAKKWEALTRAAKQGPGQEYDYQP